VPANISRRSLRVERLRGVGEPGMSVKCHAYPAVRASLGACGEEPPLTRLASSVDRSDALVVLTGP
jgi:hypothetical protein